MTRQRRILLGLLAATAALAGLGSLAYVQADRLRTAGEQVAFLKTQYVKLHPGAPVEQAGLQDRIQELKRAENAELARYYGSGEMDLYRFGSMVNALLAGHRITVLRFRTVTEASPPVLGLSARGTSSAFMAFLSVVSASPRYWTIPYLHMQSPSGDGTVTCELQIGYPVHESTK